MKSIELSDQKEIPEYIKTVLRGKPIEEQISYFELYAYALQTHSILDREIDPEKDQYRAECRSLPLDEQTIIVQDGIMIGVKFLYTEVFINAYSAVQHGNGHRTSSDYWYFDEDHLWYQLICKIKESES